MSWTLRALRHSARGATTLSLALALVAALACGCTNSASPVPVADATYGVPIEINTPQGLRAKQTIDMLNSEWPIGTVGVRTLAAPQQVNGVTSAMGNLWLDRPITVVGQSTSARDRRHCTYSRPTVSHKTSSYAPTQMASSTVSRYRCNDR